MLFSLFYFILFIYLSCFSYFIYYQYFLYFIINNNNSHLFPVGCNGGKIFEFADDLLQGGSIRCKEMRLIRSYLTCEYVFPPLLYLYMDGGEKIAIRSSYEVGQVAPKTLDHKKFEKQAGQARAKPSCFACFYVKYFYIALGVGGARFFKGCGNYTATYFD